MFANIEIRNRLLTDLKLNYYDIRIKHQRIFRFYSM
jgi:hypothetical protein